MWCLLRSRPEIVPSNLVPEIRRHIPRCGMIPNLWSTEEYPIHDGWWWRRKDGVQYILYWRHKPKTKEQLRRMGYQVIFGGKR